MKQLNYSLLCSIWQWNVLDSVAIITFCLVAIVHHDMQFKRSTYEVLQILIISLTDKTHLRDLFDKTIFNDIKELDLGSYVVLKAIHAKEADARLRIWRRVQTLFTGMAFVIFLQFIKKEDGMTQFKKLVND